MGTQITTTAFETVVHTMAISLYAATLFGATLYALSKLKRLGINVRRITTISAMGVLAHAIWLVPHLASRTFLVTPIDPYLAVSSQLAFVGGLTLALRLQIAMARSTRPILVAYLTALSSAIGIIACIVLGNLSLGLPAPSAFTPLNLTLLALSPLPLLAAAQFMRPRVSDLYIVIATIAATATLALCQYSMSQMLVHSTDATWVVQPQLAWLIAFISTIVFCLLVCGGSILKSQRDFANNIRSAIDALPIGLALFTEQDRLLVWNQSFQRLGREGSRELQTGMTYTEALKSGMTSSLFAPNARKDEDWLQERLQDHIPGDWLHQSHDQTRWVHLQNRRISNHGMVTIASDFTEQKKHEAELAAALEQARSANVAKSRFLANMSHEIRTPLNGVIAVTEALSRSLLTPKQAEMVELIRSSSDTLQFLLSDILDLARIESGQMKISQSPFDLQRLVSETQQLYANSASEKGVQFACHISPEARSWVMGDPVRTRQILSNLLSNAVKFTLEGHISLSVSRQDQNIYMRIEDTGIGFDPAKLENLFGRFQQADDQITRKYGGSGLGLAICAELAEMMGGTLKGNSQPGLGSSFLVCLPLERITAPNPSIETHAAEDLNRTAIELFDPLSSHTLRILLADDNATNRRVVQLILDANNIQLFEVENGHLALEAMERGRFDLVLMDMQMPVMDGLTATRMIRAREANGVQPRTPIIMLTANAMPEHVAASLEAGADAHLSKPFNVGQLLDLTYKLTDQKYQNA